MRSIGHPSIHQLYIPQVVSLDAVLQFAWRIKEASVKTTILQVLSLDAGLYLTLTLRYLAAHQRSQRHNHNTARLVSACSFAPLLVRYAV